MRCCSNSSRKRPGLHARPSGPPQPCWLAGLALLLAAHLLQGAPPAGTARIHASISVAMEAAQSDQGPVLAIFTRENSPACLSLMQDLLASTNFLPHAGLLHIAEVNLDAEAAPAEGFGIRAVPTLLLLSAQGQILARLERRPSLEELLSWLEKGRGRQRQGLWEGTAAPDDLEVYARKAAQDQLQSDDLPQLVSMLGEADPSRRNAASRILLSARDAAVPWLIKALADPYLGIRISAVDLLQKLAPDQPAVDPWLDPVATQEAVAGWRQWWNKVGHLPPATETRLVTPETRNAIAAAVEAVRTGGTSRQTEAMSALVGFGDAALPALRGALEKAERAGDARALGLLEDIRWAILIPETVEQRIGPLRQVLAHGKGPDRQAAAASLGKLGGPGLPALTELLSDRDPLVVEAAVRALAGLGGKESIPAMAALLKAPDANLRMSAARALGHLKSRAVTASLLTILDDPNETVACTALAALEEAHAINRSTDSSSIQELVQPLQRALQDPRWRVRAAAAEVTGKLDAKALIETLEKMLADPDAFAAKSALEALRKLQAPPSVSRLADLANNQPSLRGDVVGMLAKSRSAEASRAVLGLYQSHASAERLEILRHLNPVAERFEAAPALSTNWLPLLSQAATAPEAPLRRQTAELLSKCTLPVITNLVGSLLDDPDQETRLAAVSGVLAAFQLAEGGPPLNHSVSIDDLQEAPAILGGGSESKKRKAAIASPHLAQWHASLERSLAIQPGLRMALAHYVTSRDFTNVARLAQAFGALSPSESLDLMRSQLLASVVPRLPWPAGQPILAILEKHPLLYVQAAATSAELPEPMRAHLLAPDRLKRVLESSSSADLPALVPLLLGPDARSWSLRRSAPATVAALGSSSQPIWRALAVYVAAQRKGETNWPVFVEALGDPDPAVRVAAIPGFATHGASREIQETHLGPLTAEADPNIATTAALSLLETEVCQAASLQHRLTAFAYQNIVAYSPEPIIMNLERPLATLDRKPAFLDALKDRLPPPNTTEACIFALLLAQYGRPEGLQHCLPAAADITESDERLDVLLAGIALLQDPNHLPFVQKLLDRVTQEWGVQKLLRAIKGMRGNEARQLRAEINRRLRQ